MLQGIKCTEAEKGQSQRVHLPDITMMWAACCVGFFGFLQTGEMTVPSDKWYDPAVHQSYGNISVDNPQNPQMIRAWIKQSKTDPFRIGDRNLLGKDWVRLLPSGGAVEVFNSKEGGSKSLFLLHNDWPLTRQRLVEAVQAA